MAALQEKFVAEIERRQARFNVNLSAETIGRLAAFYEIVTIWNKRLHLVAPCSPEEFAVRHVLESLVLLEHLPANAGFADVGTGAGLPGLPCAIARPDLRATLIESNQKKAVYLREAASKLGLQNQVLIFNLRFEQMPPPETGFVACRALDKFIEKLPEIVEWAHDAEKLLFFGGASVRAALEKLDLQFAEQLIPESEQRYLFVVAPK